MEVYLQANIYDQVRAYCQFTEINVMWDLIVTGSVLSYECLEMEIWKSLSPRMFLSARWKELERSVRIFISFQNVDYVDQESWRK